MLFMQELFIYKDKSDIEENRNITVTEQLWSNYDVINYKMCTHVSTINTFACLWMFFEVIEYAKIE